MLTASACSPEVREASTLLNAGQPAKAAAILERASTRCPSSAQVFDLLGIAHALLGNSGKAQAAFRKAIELDPKTARPRVNLAVSLFGAGREEEGLRALEEAITIEPGNQLALANLGAVYARRGDCARSLEYFEAAGAEK